MRIAATIAFVLVALAAGALVPGGLAGPDDAQASHGRICGAVAKGKNDYLVVAKRIGCRKGRKGVNRYLAKRKPLRGFSCKRNVGKYAFVCRGPGAKAYRAEKL